MIEKQYKLPQILTKLMQECDLDDVKLSKHTDVPVTTISRMRRSSNANPTIYTLLPIAQFFDISTEQLLGYQPLPLNRIPGTHNSHNYTSSLIPLIEWGNIISFLENKNIFLQNKFLNWIPSERSFSSDAFALMVSTDNPSLLLKKGSIILIDKKEEIYNENLVLISTNTQDNVVLYQILLDGNDIYIKSINPEIKDIRKLPKNFKLLGQVVEIRFEIKQPKNSIRPHSHIIKRFLPSQTT